MSFQLLFFTYSAIYLCIYSAFLQFHTLINLYNYCSFLFNYLLGFLLLRYLLHYPYLRSCQLYPSLLYTARKLSHIINTARKQNNQHTTN